ncbi:hypothetical protein ONS95_008796 [Cadophora gregata]|uniref:uncharacterized protein n=1 Tax=Cadophora gregata TaxID=51156 RepID=UPI0026DBBEEF|nr:uncharacterized protein ONS95_008796 [Cadophora gregata]KAK0123795.1 hypothetical protein ONS95_008796 [Cadophora gregata]KAK0130140.1 hypothetical protein ONS96_000666 [Cadophora gregata f. sp. sojae]
MAFSKTLTQLVGTLGLGAKRHLSRTSPLSSQPPNNKAMVEELCQKAQQSEDKLRNLKFGPDEMQKHAYIKTNNHRLAIYKDLQNPNMASARIFILSRPTARAAKNMIKKNGPGRRNNVPIGEKFRFMTGKAFDMKAFREDLWREGVDGEKAAERHTPAEDKGRKGK